MRWVGEAEGVADYREFLKGKGVDVPQPPTNNGDVDDDYDDDVDDVVDVDDVDGVYDVAEGTPMVNDKRPVPGVGTVANNIETSADIDTHEQASTPIHKQTQAINRHQQASTHINRHRHA